MYNAIYTSPDYCHSWGKRGTTFHPCNSDNYHNDHFKIKGRTYIHPAHIESAIKKAWAGTDETLYKDVRLLMNGSDFSTPQPLLTDLIKQANELFSDKEFKHGTIEEYANILRGNLDKSKLAVVKGEMRDGPSSSCSSNALATRPRIKQLNKKVENAIFKIAEPFITMATLAGYKPHTEFLDIAFDHMLKAHAHDSINGVTQDKTVDDTIYNLNQALEIANTLTNDALGFIVKNTDTSAYSDEDVLITVFNPSAFDRNEVIKVFIDIPQEMSIWDFDIVDETGTVFEIQHISRKEVNVPVHELDSRPWPFYVDRQEVYFDTGIVLAGGYKTYKVKVKSTFNRSAVVWAKMREHGSKNISINVTKMENDNLKVSVNSNGSINIFDKAQNKEYTNLNYYEETGDCGDYWVYYPPYHNKTYTTKGANAEIWIEDNGSLSATIGTRIILNVPKDAEKPYKGYVGESKRNDELTPISISTYYTLTKNAKSVEVKAIINNTAFDHRMKVLFDGNTKTDYSISAGHFTVDKREIANKYPEMQTYPVGAFTGIDGLSIISNCFSEAEMTSDGCIKMSLFRGVRNVICTEFRSVGVFENQNGGQSLGELEFNYAIYPHKGNWENGTFIEYEKHQTKLYPIQTCFHEWEQPLKMTDSYYKLEGENLVLSALKIDGDNIIVRLFNPTNSTIKGSFSIKNKVKSAKSIKLNGDEIEKLNVKDSRVKFNVAQNKIYTIKLEL
jgi:mannosylglycerate hydrolase